MANLSRGEFAQSDALRAPQSRKRGFTAKESSCEWAAALNRQESITSHDIPLVRDLTVFHHEGLTVQGTGGTDVSWNGVQCIAGNKEVGGGIFDHEVFFALENRTIIGEIEQYAPFTGGVGACPRSVTPDP